MAQNQLGASVSFGVVAILYTFCIWCNWTDVKTAIDVIDASSDFLADTYRIIWSPVVHFLLQMIVLFVWLGAMCCVVSLNEISASTVVPQMKDLEWKDSVWNMCLFMIFGLLWLMAFFDYINRFIIMTAASTFYFNNKRDEPEQKPASVCKAWNIAYINHLGSIAIGSFIIAVIRFLKYTLVFLMQKLESATAGSETGAVVACFFKCATGILEYIERVTDYINETAFAYIAVTGETFCIGAL